MKASVVVDRVFQLLGDTGTTKLYNEAKDIIPAIATAQRAFFIDRPDVRMATGNAWPAVTDPTTGDSDMIIDAASTEAVANQAAFVILSTKARTIRLFPATCFVVNYLKGKGYELRNPV